ncbi:hypothetical protein C7I85_22760 [Mesorhizobium soli]|uniref:Uncharacterized protein n=1 Tax=Pseudaminobacter soli (ex Li et al. 2025) TaxID=1295366 RepID=A0A2P7S4Q9_9HYPH|nr:hypothetical protein C7I85_22760 [Mesorhizobium soli]
MPWEPFMPWKPPPPPPPPWKPPPPPPPPCSTPPPRTSCRPVVAATAREMSEPGMVPAKAAVP